MLLMMSIPKNDATRYAIKYNKFFYLKYIK